MGAYRATLSALTIAAVLAASGPAWAQSADVADRWWAEAERLREQGRFAEAAAAYARSAEAERTSPQPRWKDYGAEVSRAAHTSLEANQADTAVRLLQAGLSHLDAATQAEVAAPLRSQLADSHWVHGDRLRHRGDAAAAAEAYVRSAEAERLCPQPRWKDYGSAMILAAESLLQAERAEAAFRLFDACLATLQAASQAEFVEAVRLRLADRLWDTGQKLREQGRWADAAATYARAADTELAASAPRWKDYAAEIGQAADCRFRADEPDACFTLLNSGIERLRQANRADLSAGLWGQVGDRRQATGQFELALAAHREALAIERALGDEGAVVDRLNRLGQVTKAAGRYAESMTHFEDALALARRLGDEARVATELSNLGGAYWEMDRLKEALPYYEQALVIDRRRGDMPGESKTLNNLGTVYMGLARYDEALAHFEQAVALARRADQPRSVASALGNVGAVYNARGHYREAIARYEEALAIETRLGIKEMMAISLSNLGEAHSSLDHDDEALAYHERSLALERVLNRPGQLASTLNNIGTVQQSRGRYDLAIAAFEEALAIDRRLGRAGQTAVRLSNIGYQYRLWGRLDQALSYFDEALALDRAAGRDAQAAVDLSHKGRTFTELRRFDEAVACHEEALGIFRRVAAIDQTATAMSDLASVHHLRGDLDRATALFTEALAIDRRLGREADAAVDLSNLASVASDRNDWARARTLATEALAIERRLGKTPAVAATLSQLGVIAWRLEAPAQAIRYLEEAVTLFDRLRLTARGELRRDYLARTLNAYQQLVEAHARAGQAEAALTTSERSRAKLLAELLTGRDEVALPTLATVKASLGADTAAIVFANASQPHLVQLAVTRDGVEARMTPTEALSAGMAATGSAADPAGRRGVALEPEAEPDAAPHGLEAVVGAYRAALVRQDGVEARRLGRVLYDTLIGSLEARLKGKTRLVIVPDGVLGLVPVEALVDPQGRYVAERFEVTYAHSLAVRQLLAGRRHPADRHALLAFGGARYEAGPAPAAVASEVAARRGAQLALARGGSAAEAYGQLGLGSWAELPGTLSEVRAIAQAVPQSRVVSGEAVTEAAVKAMAATGELGRYRVLHFATHGLAVPQVPELSALVLSQLPTQPGGEDGYLRASEVAALKLRADFVNLSACETGLGKVYGGEGVVGLAQSFLVAGANGLSMSLWSVADASTATFMTELYKTVATDRVGYAEAASRVKRRFVKGAFGEAYKQPYYWAPFVHYGR